MARIAPWDFGNQQNVLDRRRRELDGLIDQLPKIFGRLWRDNRHEESLRWAIATYRFVEHMRKSSPHNPPDFGSPESRLFEEYQRNSRTFVDFPLRDLIQQARARARELERRGVSVDPGDRRVVRRADELFERKLELEDDLRESRKHWGQEKINELRSQVAPANQDWHFVATNGRSVDVCMDLVQDSEAKIVQSDSDIEMGQEAVLAKEYGVGTCEDFTSSLICAAHKELHDPNSGEGDLITRKGFNEVETAPGLPSAARDHVVVYIGPSASPEGVVCEAWTTHGRAVGVAEYSMREAHAYGNDYEEYADGRDYEAIARARYIDYEWIRTHPREDITASRQDAARLETTIAAHSDASHIFRIGHPYYGSVDPRLGRPLDQDTLRATADKNFVVRARYSPAPLTDVERGELLSSYLPPSSPRVESGDRTLLGAASSSNPGSSLLAAAAAGQYGYGQYGYGQSSSGQSTADQYGYGQSVWPGNRLGGEFAGRGSGQPGRGGPGRR